MRIYCDDVNVFEAAQHRELQRMLMRVRRGQHSLIVDDLDGFYETRFFAMAVADGDTLEVQELLREQNPVLADRGLDPGKRAPGPRAELVLITLPERACRCEGNHPVWEIDPSTCGDWSEQPLRVLLENDNDWALIEVAARVYASNDSTMHEHTKTVRTQWALEQRFLRKDQRGGIPEVAKAVEDCGPGERVFVLVDSDKSTKDGEEGPHQKRLRKRAQTRPNVCLFILEKREAENYLPETILQNFVNQQWPPPNQKSIGKEQRENAKQRRKYAKQLQKKLETWQSLSEDEKDFIDLEKEYFGKRIKDEVANLKEALLVPDAQTLESRDHSKNLKKLLEQLEAWL